MTAMATMPVRIDEHREHSTSTTLSPGGGAPEFETQEFEVDAVVESKNTVARDVVELVLRRADDLPFPAWSPGAHVDLMIEGVATRQYSLCGDPADGRHWRVAILRDPNGSGGSRYVHDDLRAGARVRVRGPRNHFALAPSPRYLFIAGGIGITPLLAMVREAERTGAQWTLVYGGREAASMAFCDELAAYGERVTYWPQDGRGLIDLEDLLGTPRPDTLVYCCGPAPLLEAVEERCASWPRGSLHIERFTAKKVGEPVRSASFEVRLDVSGIDLTIEPDQSILGAVRDAGIDVLHSCGAGTCGTCETPVLEGIPDHRDSVLDDEERESNACMMICVSRACTSRLVLEL